MLFHLKKQIQQHEANLQRHKSLIGMQRDELISDTKHWLASPKTLLAAFSAGFSWSYLRASQAKPARTKHVSSSGFSKLSSIVTFYQILKRFKLFPHSKKQAYQQPKDY